MTTDPIADFLTRIRNAMKAKHSLVTIPSSNLKKEMARVLHEKGYIRGYKLIEDSKQGQIKIALKYNQVTKEPVISNITRISSPGLRKYSSFTELPRVLNGLGIAILSTSRGVLTDKEARKEGVGGEVLCYVY